MRQFNPSVEQRSPFESLAHKGSLALKIGLGALAVREVWKYTGIGESITEYAKSRAHDLLQQAKPPAGRAYTFLRSQISDYISGRKGGDVAGLADSVGESYVAESIEPAAVSDTLTADSEAAGTTSEAVSEDPAAPAETEELISTVAEDQVATEVLGERPEAPVYDLDKIFESGASLVEAYGDRDLPETVRRSLQELVRAWRSIRAVPAAAQLWDSYVRPSLSEVSQDAAKVSASAERLKAKADKLAMMLGAIAANIEEHTNDGYQRAFAVYESEVRGGEWYANNHGGSRKEFEDEAASYDSAKRSEDQSERKLELVNASDETIRSLVEQFVSNSHSDNPSETEFEQIIQSVKHEVTGSVTREELERVTKQFKDQATAHESVEAAQRRALMFNALDTRYGSTNHQSSAVRHINSLRLSLMELDNYINGHTIQLPEAVLRINSVATGLSSILWELNTDERHADHIRSVASQLLATIR